MIRNSRTQILPSDAQQADNFLSNDERQINSDTLRYYERIWPLALFLDPPLLLIDKIYSLLHSALISFCMQEQYSWLHCNFSLRFQRYL